MSLVMMTDMRFCAGATVEWSCDKARSDVRRVQSEGSYATAWKWVKIAEDGRIGKNLALWCLEFSAG